jgi:hypothetical protein
MPLDLLDLRLCHLDHRPPERDPATSRADGASPGSTSTIDTWTCASPPTPMRKHAERVPPRNPRDGCWRLIAGSGCRVGCRTRRPSCVGREPCGGAHPSGDHRRPRGRIHRSRRRRLCGHAVRGSRLWPTGGRDLDAGCNPRPRPTALDGCLDNLRQLDSQAALRAAWLRSYRGVRNPV